MKKIILISSIIIYYAQSISAQFVTIPDANFRNILKSVYPTCFNTENKMDTTCTPILNETIFEGSFANLTNLDGIQYFKNLKGLYPYGNQLVSLPKLPAGLLELVVNNNKITDLPTLPLGLTMLNAQNNPIVSLPTLPIRITSLNCSKMFLTSLPTLPPKLEFLDFSENDVAICPTFPSSLKTILCNKNELKQLSSLPDSLQTLDISYNSIDLISDFPSKLKILKVNDNLNLRCLSTLPNFVTEITLTGSVLKCLPNKPNALQVVFNQPTAQVEFDYPVCNGTSFCVTALEENALQTIAIYPIPSSSGNLTIESEEKPLEITLSDLYGKQEKFLNTSKIHTELNGVLIMTIRTATEVVNSKVLVE